MRSESVNTGDGTTAPPDPSTLPVPLEPPVKIQPSHLSASRGRTSRKRALNSSTALACLDPVDILSIELDRNCFSLQLEKCYSIRDVCEDKVVLRGVQDFHPFHFDGLKNVIIRDAENLPVARVCFKQKSLLYSSMALAVYAPCDVLVGTGEETSGLFMFTSRLILRNSDGDELFFIEYTNKVLSSSFVIKSAADKNGEAVAKIMEKSRNHVRLQFTTKMNLSSKIILLGFCMGLVNKYTPPNKPPQG